MQDTADGLSHPQSQGNHLLAGTVMHRTLAVSLLILIVALSACGGQTDVADQPGSENITSEVAMTGVDHRDIPLQTIKGEPTTLKSFDGQVLLLVNVASECGYTKQYAGLERLYRQYRERGVTVIGFPANNFGGQEPGSNEEILSFCQTKFEVSFPMMAKISVKGDDKHPLFTHLTEGSDYPGEIKWNFSKFLLNREGHLVARFDSGVEPLSDELTSAIKKVL